MGFEFRLKQQGAFRKQVLQHEHIQAASIAMKSFWREQTERAFTPPCTDPPPPPFNGSSPHLLPILANACPVSTAACFLFFGWLKRQTKEKELIRKHPIIKVSLLDSEDGIRLSLFFSLWQRDCLRRGSNSRALHYLRLPLTFLVLLVKFLTKVFSVFCRCDLLLSCRQHLLELLSSGLV